MSNLVLEFSDKILRALEVTKEGEIILKDELKLSFNINDESGQKINFEEIKKDFLENIGNLLKNNGNDIKTAGVLINTGQTFLNVFPVDFNDEQSNIDSHILWELSNYFPETYKNFNIKYYRLINNPINENVDEVLLIAIDKNKIELIKNLCNAANIKIRNIEIDHFAVEKCLPPEYKTENKNLLLIGCKNSRMDYSLISSGKLRYYDYQKIDEKKFKNSLIDMLNFFNLTFKDIEYIFLYGDEYTINVDKFLKEEFQDLNTSMINFDNTIDTRFTPLLGLALKNFSLQG